MSNAVTQIEIQLHQAVPFQNLGLSQMIGNLLQDEKFPGVHIAFGDPYGNQTHADCQLRTHVDVLTRNCDMWIDKNQIIAKGCYQLDHLGL